MAEQLKVLQDIINLIKTTKGELDGVKTSIVAISKEARKSQNAFNFKTPKSVSTQLQKNAQYTKQLNAAQKEKLRLETALERQLAKKNAILTTTNRNLEKAKLETRELTKQVKLQEQSENKLLGAYTNLNAKLALMRKAYKDLAAKKVQGIALTKKEEKEYQRLGVQVRKTDADLKRINRSVGQNFRNVGNYSSAIGGLGRSLRSLASAFGLTSGVFLFASAVRDAFQRVRDFDKSMQNLAGVMRTTRADLKDLESTIIGVASVTVRTSNEVAQLAESLATLGKSKDEIKDLLKPIIDLSLGLDAPADEAGEFLVQMLNTFGKSTDSAEEFADTIATIRTSTTLTFQKMRDSFQYIAPISRVLGEDLAYTGSVVGILADNGLKAESSGRILASAMVRLATKNKTLAQALEEINTLYDEGASSLEILSLANDLFGKQAAKAGAILALNTDAIETNAQAIRDNGGALEDLTNQQLESLDAKLKILDSTYEGFILSMDNGNSVIGKTVKFGIERLTEAITILQFTSDKAGNALKAVFGILTLNASVVSDAADELKQMGVTANDTTRAIREQNKAFIEMHGSLAPLTETQQDIIDKQKEINMLFGGSANGYGALPDDENITKVQDLKDQIKTLNDEILASNKNDIEGIRVKQEKIKSLQKELDAILGTTKATKEKNNAVKGSIKYLQSQISKLEEIRDTTSLTNEEYEKFNKQIAVLKFQVSELNGEYEDFLDSLNDPLPDVKFEDLFKDGDKKDDKNFYNSLNFTDIEEMDALERFEYLQELEKGILDDRLELRKEFYSNLKNLALSSINAIFDAEVDKYNDRIDANNEYYNALLDNEKLTEDQRAALEAERERKNEELERKKRETEKKAFLFGQLKALAEVAISTTKAVAAIKSQAGVLLSNPITAGLAPLALSQIPFVIGSGAAAAGAIVATSIPQFKEGHLEGTHEGAALINDASGSNFQEIVERKDGRLEMFKERNRFITMERGDKVHKAGTFNGKDILKQSLLLSMQGQQERLTASQEKQLNIGQELQKAFRSQKQPNVNVQAAPIDYHKLAAAVRVQNKINKI